MKSKTTTTTESRAELYKQLTRLHHRLSHQIDALSDCAARCKNTQQEIQSIQARLFSNILR